MTKAIQNTPVKEFGEMFLKGMEYLLKACQLYVKTIDKDPEAIIDFEETYPDISTSAWRRFEAVGRGSLHVKLLTNLTVGAKKLERCSYTEQAKYSEEPLDVLLADGDMLKVGIHNLQPAQLKQVFASDHIRTRPEQRAYLESLKTEKVIETSRKEAAEVSPPYEIKRGKLVVGGVTFTKSDLVRILVQLEK